MIRANQTLRGILSAYLLRTEVKDSTATWYGSLVNSFCAWFGGDIPDSELSADMLNAFLKAKQDDGCSSHYRQSLKTGLKVLLGSRIDRREVRKIKLEKIDPPSWTPCEVQRLIGCCEVLPEKHRQRMRLAIAVAYHTGLSQIDLHRLSTPEHIRPSGTIHIRRSKTGEEAVVAIPPGILAHLPKTGLAIPLVFSREMFRRYFRRVVDAAKLKGTFKVLRNSSGTEAELINGRGHEHLANSRKVFEKHYLNRDRLDRKPVVLSLPQVDPLLESPMQWD